MPLLAAASVYMRYTKTVVKRADITALSQHVFDSGDRSATVAYRWVATSGTVGVWKLWVESSSTYCASSVFIEIGGENPRGRETRNTVEFASLFWRYIMEKRRMGCV